MSGLSGRSALALPLAMLVVVAGALALRLPQLGLRPLHNDEAVNAVKVSALWSEGRYAYDPDEYHGPTLHYASLPFLSLSGAGSPDKLTDAQLRLAPVAFGAGLVLLCFLFGSGLGRAAATWAAIFTAVSPAMVFYSRYFIHEILLVFFTALALAAAWRYWQTRAWTWALITGAAVGLMWATKETFVFVLVAAAFAIRFEAALARRRTRHAPAPIFHSELEARTPCWNTAGRAGAPPPAAGTCPQHVFAARCGERALPGHEISRLAPNAQPGEQRANAGNRHRRVFWSQLAAAATVALILGALFFSSFLQNPAGVTDAIRTYLPWLHRAGGQSPHLNPATFYLERLMWFHSPKGPAFSEAFLVALALTGGAVGLSRQGRPLERLLLFYSAALTGIYCLIPYKTPWCLLGFWHGWILLAGTGAAWLIRRAQSKAGRALIAGVLLAGVAHLTWQTWLVDGPYAADRRNPYAYAQTSPDLRRLAERVEAIARLGPEGLATVIKTVAPGSDYWPLPWSLRRCPNTGWYDALPPDPYAPIIIVAAALNAHLDETSGRKWIMAGLTELRPGKFLELYVELELWKKFVATLPRPKDDE